MPWSAPDGRASGCAPKPPPTASTSRSRRSASSASAARSFTATTAGSSTAAWSWSSLRRAERDPERAAQTGAALRLSRSHVVVVVVDVEQEVEQVDEHDVEHDELVLHELFDPQPWLPPQLDCPPWLCFFFPPEPWELHASGTAPTSPTRAREPRIKREVFLHDDTLRSLADDSRLARGQERPSRRGFVRSVPAEPSYRSAGLIRP